MKFYHEIRNLLDASDQMGWWCQAAAYCLDNGHFEAIPSRDGTKLYLLRCWLSQPIRGDDGRWKSENSVLLHGFAQADDDGALHDHPWDFETRILQGGYIEHRGDCTSKWLPGDRTARRAGDYHSIYELLGPTWTLVTTGPAVKDWGFLVDGKHVPHQEFLKSKYKEH